MTKTANITCEFEYELCIGQLTQRDTKLAEEMFGYRCVDTNKFYKVAQEFHGEILPESELDHLAKLVKDLLYGKLQTSLPRHFASNGGAKVANIVMTEFSYKDGLCVRPRVQRVFAVVYITISIEATLDDGNEINYDKLFRLIADRYNDECWSGELANYVQTTRFGELEIEYR